MSEYGNCEQWYESLSAYMDEELSATEMQEIKAHLLHCSSCRMTLQEFKGMREDLRENDRQIIVPENMSTTVMKHITMTRQNAQITRVGIVVFAMMMIAALLSLIAVISPLGVFFWSLFHFLLFIFRSIYGLRHLVGVVWITGGLSMAIVITILWLVLMKRVLKYLLKPKQREAVV